MSFSLCTIWVNIFYTSGSSKTISSEAWYWLVKSWYDSFMPLIRSTSNIISIISLYYKAKLNFFAGSKTSLKILHFRTTSASTICLFFPSDFAPMLWSIRNKIFYVLDENSKLVKKNSHALYHMTNPSKAVGFSRFYLLALKLKTVFQSSPVFLLYFS